VESAMIDVDNAWEILHFVQNDRESRQWILRYALNDEEKKADKAQKKEPKLLFEIYIYNTIIQFHR